MIGITGILMVIIGEIGFGTWLEDRSGALAAQAGVLFVLGLACILWTLERKPLRFADKWRRRTQ